MTSTNMNIGIAEGERKSSRVLKPPGGGSSCFFDAAGPDEAPRRRVDCNKAFFGEVVSETPTRATKPGNDTHHRLFGEEVVKPPTPYGHKSKANLGFCEDLENVRVISADQDGNLMKAEGINGTDGIKEATYSDSVNVNVVNTPSSTPRRGRVPPGGFSSGFW